jgi:oxidase EvaA
LHEKNQEIDNIKLCPSFSATQSNINRAHGGKKTPLSEFILSKNKNLICETLHFEEGARFWKKPNKNLLISIDYKKSLKIKNPDFIWLNLSQIKKLNLKKGILNPFVKTILFII